jgi:hypothetical protein
MRLDLPDDHSQWLFLLLGGEGQDEGGLKSPFSSDFFPANASVIKKLNSNGQILNFLKTFIAHGEFWVKNK